MTADHDFTIHTRPLNGNPRIKRGATLRFVTVKPPNKMAALATFAKIPGPYQMCFLSKQSYFLSFPASVPTPRTSSKELKARSSAHGVHAQLITAVLLQLSCTFKLKWPPDP